MTHFAHFPPNRHAKPGQTLALHGRTRHKGVRRGPAAFLAALSVILLSIPGCNAVDRLLEVESPSRLPEDRFLVPENASQIVDGAVADFQCALGAYVVASVMAAGEFFDASQTASRWSYDRRDVRPSDSHYSTFGCAAIGVYTPLSVARYTNDQAWRALEGWTDQQVPARQRSIALTSALAGYSLLLLGEGFCSGVIDVGPELTSQQLFDSAEVRFTTAITAAQAAGDAELLNLAYAGRARARRDGGDLSGAAADAALVPVSFVYDMESGTASGRQNNRVYAQNNTTSGGITVATAYRDLTIGGEPDPRVPVVDAEQTASDQVNTIWRQEKYTSLSAPIPLATGIEAQLILAEARGGSEGVAILNALRESIGLPALTAAEEANFTETLFEERSRWLFLQGNRWYDLRLSQLPLNPATGSQYPKGGLYGDQRCWPLPDVERLANPNL
jgi:hypothetical protein